MKNVRDVVGKYRCTVSPVGSLNVNASFAERSELITPRDCSRERMINQTAGSNQT